MTRLAHLAYDHARSLLVVAFAIFAVAVVVGTPVVGLLSTDNADFLSPSSQSIVARNQLDKQLPPQLKRDVIALVPAGVDPARVQRVLARQPEITSTASVKTSPDPSLLSIDKRQSIVSASLREHNVDEVKLADRLRAQVPAGVKIGGQEIVGPEIGTKVSQDLTRAEMIAFPLLFLLSLWVFRGVIAAALPPLIGAVTIVVTFLILRGVNGQITSLSVFAANLVTGIGLGLSIDYSLFIISRFREESASGKETRDALAMTLRTAGRTVLFSGVTIAAAMASLLIFPMRFLYSMGIGGVIGALVGATVALTVLPAILALLGPRINSLAPARWRRAAEREASPVHHGAWYKLATAVMKRPATVALLTGGFLIVLGLPFLRVHFVAADQRVLPVGNEARVVTETVERDFPEGAIQSVDVLARTTDQAAVEKYDARLKQLPGVGPVSAPVQISPDAFVIRIRQRGDPLSNPNLNVVRAVRGAAAPFPKYVASQGSAFVDQRDVIASHLLPALILLCSTTFVALFLMTGSLILPIKALIMNFLTISAAFGILVFIFQDGRLEGLLDYKSLGGLEQSQPVLLFAITFGLATDYGVFLLSRIKEARDSGMAEKDSVRFGVERTGRIITAAALLFCVAVGAFATSGIVFIKQLGVGIAIAVAIDATIVRALLVPALMALLGRWNWWAPARLKRLHERIGLAQQ